MSPLDQSPQSAFDSRQWKDVSGLNENFLLWKNVCFQLDCLAFKEILKTPGFRQACELGFKDLTEEEIQLVDESIQYYLGQVASGNHPQDVQDAMVSKSRNKRSLPLTIAEEISSGPDRCG